MSRSDRSPLHPKALSLEEFRRIPRGNSVLLCHHDARSFVATDAVRSFGIVEIREESGLPWEKWVVINPTPPNLQAEVRWRTPFGARVSALSYPGIPVVRIPYRRPRFREGYAFPLGMLGLQPVYRNQWSRFWFMRVADL